MLPDAINKKDNTLFIIIVILIGLLVFEGAAYMFAASEARRYKNEIAALKQNVKECREDLNVCTQEAEKRKLASKRIKDTTWGDLFDAINRIKCHAKKIIESCDGDCSKPGAI